MEETNERLELNKKLELNERLESKDPLGYKCTLMYRYLKSDKSKRDEYYYNINIKYLEMCDPKYKLFKIGRL